MRTAGDTTVILNSLRDYFDIAWSELQLLNKLAALSPAYIPPRPLDRSLPAKKRQ